MKLKTRWFDKILGSETGRAERREPDDFIAYYWNHSTLKEDAVRNVSSTGVYIVTNERWATGTIISLTLQKQGSLERHRGRRITTRARVVRADDEGVGLAFIVPSDHDGRSWDGLVETLVEQTKINDMSGLVRMAEALKFLGQLCPTGATSIGELVRNRISSPRLANAVDIALKAQDFLSAQVESGQLKGNPYLIERVLGIGSSAEESWLRDFWAGLLVTSCSADGKDESNREFVDLFAELTNIPLRILTVVCKAARFHAGTDSAIASVTCSLDEMVTITGVREVQIERDLEKLSSIGLVEVASQKSSDPEGTINVTPTQLALQLFARCNGIREVPIEVLPVEASAKALV
jgi:hypothetical protein